MSQGATQSDSHIPETEDTRNRRDAVIAALGRVENGQRDALDELRTTLCGYVEALRRGGASRDAVLTHIGEVIAQPATPGGMLALTPTVREALTELTLEWCRAEYARIALG
jgi:hypothetical protein